MLQEGPYLSVLGPELGSQQAAPVGRRAVGGGSRLAALRGSVGIELRTFDHLPSQMPPSCSWSLMRCQ